MPKQTPDRFAADALAPVRDTQAEYCAHAHQRLMHFAEENGIELNGLFVAGVMAELKSMWEHGFLVGFAGGTTATVARYDEALHTKR